MLRTITIEIDERSLNLLIEELYNRNKIPNNNCTKIDHIIQLAIDKHLFKLR